MLAQWRREWQSSRPTGLLWLRTVDALEIQLERERERVGLWLPVAFGGGIALWFWLPTVRSWVGVLLILGTAGCTAALGAWHRRSVRMLGLGALVMAAGLSLIWLRAIALDAAVLARPVTTAFQARIERVEMLPAREQIRLLVRPMARADLPPLVRLTSKFQNDRAFVAGEVIAVRARLMPPPMASLPGGYDFSQRAWFDGIGAVGTILGEVGRTPAQAANRLDVRARLSQHILSRVEGSAGGIAAAFVTGDRGAISDADAEAMRRSGLAHLLSISGLHVTAVVGFAMLLLMRLLALNQRLALRGIVPLLAATGGALAGIGYTLLTGAEVPTIRSCIAAVLILLAFMLGREALTLRLVAAGAIIVLLWRPESVVGPSFQLSFAAVTAIVALHETSFMRTFLARRGEAWPRRLMRGLVGLLLTGIAVELALLPIALFHFHKAGLYGALANIIAIPLTTFIVMPAEALGLLFDVVGLGAPFWWAAQQSLDGLIALAHAVAGAPGAVASFPHFPVAAFAMTILGGLWFLLWHQGWRWAGMMPVIAGGLAMMAQHPPDLLVTNDGKHIAVATADGAYALLRDRAGEFVRNSLSEAAGSDAPFAAIADLPAAECNRDFCRWSHREGGGSYQILASRGNVPVDADLLADACAGADIVISDRWLPDSCRARWVVIDRDSLAKTGGLAIRFSPPAIATSLKPLDEHPWHQPQRVSGNDEAVPTGGPVP